MRSVRCDAATRVQLNEFHKYFVEYWLKKIGAANFSVAGADLKTNNALESLHGRMNRELGQHLSFFNLVLRLDTNLWYPTRVKSLQQRQGYLQATHHYSRYDRETMEAINKLEGQYLNGELSPKDYLIQVCYTFKHKI